MTWSTSSDGGHRLRGRVMSGWSRRRSRLVATGMTLGLSAVLLGVTPVPVAQASNRVNSLKPAKTGELDCNGDSPTYKSVREMTCTDIKGILGVDNPNTWGGKFYDNGQYIGHDEPDTTFRRPSPAPAATSRSPRRSVPTRAAPTIKTPGKDVSHWFQLTPAPWISMALCDNSYPQALHPALQFERPRAVHGDIPEPLPRRWLGVRRDAAVPAGQPPFLDAVSCDDTHWCAALTIDSLECTADYGTCNGSCEEPQNFAFIQTDGQPDCG